jgi:hypothetical protein
MNCVKRNGQVAVLVSHGFGAGWSTWNPAYPEMLYDPDVVELLEAPRPMFPSEQEEAICALLARLGRYPDAYFGGADGLRVHWVPSKARFRIDEYDGSESLVLLDSDPDTKEAP